MKRTGKHGQEYERVILEIPSAALDAYETERARWPRLERRGLWPAEFYDTLIVGMMNAPLHAATTSRVDTYAKLEVGLGMTIGEFVHIASFAHIGIGGGITILEDGTSFASGSKVISGSNVPGAGRSCSATAPGNLVEHGFAWIRANAVLFAGAIVTPGVTVGVDAVIAAGAVVLEDVPAGEVWAGVPARRVGVVAL